MKIEGVPMVNQEHGTMKKAKILTGTWVFRIKRFPSGLMRKSRLDSVREEICRKMWMSLSHMLLFPVGPQ